MQAGRSNTIEEEGFSLKKDRDYRISKINSVRKREGEGCYIQCVTE